MPAVNPALVVAAVLLLVVAAVQSARAIRPDGPPMSADHAKARVGLAPRSSPGWWSVGLALAYLLLLASIDVVPGIDPFDPDREPVLAVAEKLLFGATAGAAFVAGFIAVRKRGDRSVLVYVCMAITLWVGLIPVVASFFFE